MNERNPDYMIQRAEAVHVHRSIDLLMGIVVVAVLPLTEKEAQLQCDVIKIAEQYIAKTYPSFDSTGKKLVVTESANLWEITYELPPWMLGGAPIITIDKQTCRVVRARREQ